LPRGRCDKSRPFYENVSVVWYLMNLCAARRGWVFMFSMFRPFPVSPMIERAEGKILFFVLFTSLRDSGSYVHQVFMRPFFPVIPSLSLATPPHTTPLRDRLLRSDQRTQCSVVLTVFLPHGLTCKGRGDFSRLRRNFFRRIFFWREIYHCLTRSTSAPFSVFCSIRAHLGGRPISTLPPSHFLDFPLRKLRSPLILRSPVSCARLSTRLLSLLIELSAWNHRVAFLFSRLK